MMENHPELLIVEGYLGRLIFDHTAYVPGLRETILSLEQLDRDGCQTTISDGKMHVT